ncbi:MAG: 3-oxoacyl-ACP reductase FabG [Duodenibacillus sp.]|nr:3-oxoacyl-ACP reductase FabG [Duodenibacillus sp.]
MSEPSISKLRVLVTGASRGIGRAVAVALARAGYDLAVHGSKPSEALEETRRLCQAEGADVRTLAFDVCDAAAAREMLEADIAECGMYYGIVNNAGIACDTTFAAMTEDEWNTVLRTDLDGFFHVVQPLVMPLVRRRKPGRIVIVSSVSGILGNRGQVNYSAAKAGLIGAAKALAVELASRNITVNAVAPGLIETGMLTDEVKARALPVIPMGRPGRPEDVADLIVFLLSDKAGYITRQVISVNGGLV